MQGCNEPPAQLTAQFLSLQKWRLPLPFLSLSQSLPFNMPPTCLQESKDPRQARGCFLSFLLEEK